MDTQTPTPDPEREADTARPEPLQPHTPASTGPDPKEVAKKLEEMRTQGGPSLPPSSPQETPRKATSLLDFGARTEQEAASYEVIRIGADVTLVVPFTEDAQEIVVHWNHEPEIKGYIPTHSSAMLKLVPRVNDALALRGLA